ncbi:MAG: glycoside hydrolase family 65 protein [Actinobacteria bacterium]|nr:MAG: glycoside hydrolase family 65 protein [Actinomycetota bacterium]
MAECVGEFPEIECRPFKIIVFSWQGLAVGGEQGDARALSDCLEGLLEHGVHIVAATEGGLEDVEELYSRIRGPHVQNLFISTHAGAEIFGFDSESRPILLHQLEGRDALGWVSEHLGRRRNIDCSQVLVVSSPEYPLDRLECKGVATGPGGRPAEHVVLGAERPEGPAEETRLGGGPACFLELMRAQLRLQRDLAPYPDDSFRITAEGYEPLREREIESLFTVGNGYAGTRGSLEEQAPGAEPATLVAGVYDRAGADDIDELVIMPDWLFTRIYIDGKRLDLNGGSILEHRRVLDMRKGVVYRFWRHRDSSDRITAVQTAHFISLADEHSCVMRISVTPENYRGKIRVTTGLRCYEGCHQRNLRTERQTRSGPYGAEVLTRTAFTDTVASQVHRSHVRSGYLKVSHRYAVNELSALENYRWEADIGQEVSIDKFVAICTSRDGEDPSGRARRRAAELAESDYVDHLLEQIRAWEERWLTSSIRLSEKEGQLWAHFAAYHLISAGNPNDERVSISARALSGPIYKGHFFWDSEMYIVPFFVATHPATARAMLMYRYHTLEAAREKAGAMGYKGALFAWESTITGEEMTPHGVLAPTGEFIAILSGVLEHHIDVAIAHAAWSYWNATGDDEFMFEAGVEILIETARFWATRVQLRNDEYHIIDIEGPDEYHENVDDNMYTNMMAAWNLNRASEMVELMRDEEPRRWAQLRAKVGFDDVELGRWHEVAKHMYRDVDPSSGLIEAFAGYFQLEDIRVTDYEPRTAPLDVVLGERIHKTQAVKQADVVMILYLLEECFDEDFVRRNYLYYEARTGHGSSLSPSIYGIVAARLGMHDKALRYFHQAGTIDLANNMGNAAGGIHAAALGGLWQLLTMGFGGVRMCRGRIALDPNLPPEWDHLGFSFVWRGCRLGFEIERDRRIVLDIDGQGEVDCGIHHGECQKLAAGARYVSAWDGTKWESFVKEGLP